MKQKRFTARWQTYYFKLEDGFLTHYEKKSLVGTRKNKVNRWWDKQDESMVEMYKPVMNTYVQG